MKNSDLIAKLKLEFSGQSTMTTNQLAGFLMKVFPSLSQSTISWKIGQLKKSQLIFQKGRGIYTFDYKPEYPSELSLKAKRLYNRIKPVCKGELCMWELAMLSDISDMQKTKNWYFLSVAKDELEALFDEMLDFSKKTYIQPNKETISRYVIAQDEAIILTPLVSETPTQENGVYLTPTIEGLLVNACMKYESYLKPLGFDVTEMYSNALHKYNVNESKLLRYAARRDRRNEINELIKTLR
jgi:hypothetical protein